MGRYGHKLIGKDGQWYIAMFPGNNHSLPTMVSNKFEDIQEARIVVNLIKQEFQKGHEDVLKKTTYTISNVDPIGAKFVINLSDDVCLTQAYFVNNVEEAQKCIKRICKHILDYTDLELE